MRIVISLVLVAVTTFLGYWLVLDERKHSQAIAYNESGNVLSELKRYDEAIEHYQQAIKIKSNFAEAYNNLANAMRQKGKIKESIAYYNEAIRFKSDYA
ncbi:MAG: tetratricopeptide repeat protein, partial [Nitrospinaceae bacterium]|nr:tetratricopeptide repeat protein [Nitrospinaceae bacterium]